jgi:hypothetical protein
VREGVPIVRETFGASLQAAQAALVALASTLPGAPGGRALSPPRRSAAARKQAAIEGENEGSLLALANEGATASPPCSPANNNPAARPGERATGRKRAFFAAFGD